MGTNPPEISNDFGDTGYNRIEPYVHDDMTAEEVKAAVEYYRPKIDEAKKEIGEVIFGQEEMVDRTLTCIFAGGNIYLEGMPGLAKTLFANTLSTVLGLASGRIQCTPDLLPSDVTGGEVMEETPDGKREFRYIKGPVFTQQLLVDEINRASPRTQSALLQAMQEKEVTIGNDTRDLPQPFFVIATANPVDQEGTYPVPEAQLDRFLMMINVDYPSFEDEVKIAMMVPPKFKHRTLEEVEEDEKKRIRGEKVELYKSGAAEQVMESSSVANIQNLARHIAMPIDVVEFAVSLVRATRPNMDGSLVKDEESMFGSGPRGSQAIISTARVRALMDNRLAISIDDVKDVAKPILKHRIKLSYGVKKTPEDIVDEIIETLENKRNATPTPVATPAAQPA